jgi:hypothetical protein
MWQCDKLAVHLSVSPVIINYIITDIKVMVVRILGRRTFEMSGTLQHTVRPKQATTAIEQVLSPLF